MWYTGILPARITLHDIAAQANVRVEDLNTEVSSQRVLLDLAEFCVDWRLVGIRLGLTNAEIVAVDRDNRTEDEKRYVMLEIWKRKFAFKATYRVLIEAILACGQAQQATDACRVIALSLGKSLNLRHQNRVALPSLTILTHVI